MNKQPDRNTGDMAAQTPGSDPETSAGQPQIPPTTSSVAKTLEKNPFSISGGTPSTILPSAASIQLAQLQAQLTLQRLKFAQSAVNSNTAAASVLSQVLTKVAMSQPLFNSLIGATSAQAVGCMPGPAMPPAGLAYPPQTPALTALVAGGMGQGGSLQTQSSSPLTMNPFVGMTSQSSAHSGTPAMNLSKPASSQPSGAFSEYPADFSCKSSAASNHTYMHDEVLPTQGFHPFGFSGDIPNILPGNHGPVKGPQLLSQPHPGFQMDFQNSQASRMQALGFLGEMSAGGFPQVQPSANPQNQGNWTPDQWQNLQPNRPEFAAQPQDMWPSKGQQLHMRNELYNPEEPTSEGKSMVGQPPHLNRPSNCNQNVCGPPFNPRDRPPPGSLPERQMQPRELNDFHGLVPSQLPHICSICDKKVFNLKDWEHHVKGKHHIQNCTIFSESSGIGSNNFTRSTNGGVNSCGTSTILTPSDFPLDNSQSHLRTYPPLSHGFSSPPPGSKLFPQRKPGPSRVVHICNLPDGSCTESDVINLGLPFGKVTNYILMRATNQAFLEMAYPEAAQAMVQFYQQKPPAIGEQQLLVRMSKQYKELKLKKPGKNVDSIINDINSQKEREMQKSWDRFPPERPRSRSPFMQSLSPKMESHSPSLTSCCSSQRSSLSPRKGSMSPMLVTKGEWSNGLERRGSRDYHFHKRRNEEKSETTLKNYSGDESDKRGFDRRQYLKSSGRSSPQLLEDSGDGYQGYKDKYAKSGPQNLIPPHSKYKMQNVEDYKKEHKLKSVRRHHSPRTKEKGRDVHQWTGKRTSSSHQDQTEHKDEFEGPISPTQTDAQEEKGRNKQDETSDSEVDEENSQCSSKKRSSPRSSRLPEPETERSTKEQSTSSESGSETEGEAWYSGSLEEFVTVDEVGGEEEHLMEVQQEAAEIQESEHIQTEQDGEMEASIDNLIIKETVIDCGHPSENLQNSSPRDPKSMSPTLSLGSDRLNMESENHSELVSNSMNEMQQIAEEELQRPVDYQSCETGKLFTENESIDQLDAENQCRPTESCENDVNQQQEHSSSEVAEPPRTDQALASISIRSPETAEIKKQYPEGISGENLSQPMQEPAGRNQQPPHIQQTQLPWKHNNVFSNLSIPLGVEFVEARTGFYCKLCGLFYITEEAAKTSHCRSPVHYKNLQKYLSQLAEESLQEGERDGNPGMEEEVGIMPQFETKESNPS
ncbi:RNA-binding protein 20 isoform X1 [Hemitrygon akajei]|uniref:RNA-binding protein 20 isoform X1 n=2 Tax=Hemitrygon akajei TaxID=2704970 RepID=UPI003BF9AC81